MPTRLTQHTELRALHWMNIGRHRSETYEICARQADWNALGAPTELTPAIIELCQRPDDSPGVLFVRLEQHINVLGGANDAMQNAGMASGNQVARARVIAQRAHPEQGKRLGFHAGHRPG